MAQYRHPVGTVLELPVGMLEYGEVPLSAAIRLDDQEEFAGSSLCFSIWAGWLITDRSVIFAPRDGQSGTRVHSKDCLCEALFRPDRDTARVYVRLYSSSTVLISPVILT